MNIIESQGYASVLADIRDLHIAIDHNLNPETIEIYRRLIDVLLDALDAPPHLRKLYYMTTSQIHDELAKARIGHGGAALTSKRKGFEGVIGRLTEEINARDKHEADQGVT